jgi:3-hydroxyisobutyrate dehydrogenase-like beta-hydroxyacid dehydrogenase
VGAQAGTLSFMIGAPDDLVPHILPVLKLMGNPDRLFHTGPPGSGLGAKLANNYLAGTITLATSEAMNMGIRMGLDRKKLASIFAVSTSKNWIAENNNPAPHVTPGSPAERDYNGGFRLALCKKDIGLALAAAKMVDAKMMIGPAVLKTYETACEDENLRDKDVSVLYRYIGGIEEE